MISELAEHFHGHYLAALEGSSGTRTLESGELEARTRYLKRQLSRTVRSKGTGV